MKTSGALIMSLALWACSTQRDATAVDYDAIVVPVERLASDEVRDRGRVLFRAKCALCHGVRADGKRFWPHAPVNTLAAQGNKNNICLIVPDWNMVVVRMGLDKIILMEQYDNVFELLAPSKASR